MGKPDGDEDWWYAHLGEDKTKSDTAASSHSDALAALQQAARSGGNVFEALLDAVRVCSLGQNTGALFEEGAQYLRNM
jgi:methylmalonyl-CoA mutase N-terminal domain/subunit